MEDQKLINNKDKVKITKQLIVDVCQLTQSLTWIEIKSLWNAELDSEANILQSEINLFGDLNISRINLKD